MVNTILHVHLCRCKHESCTVQSNQYWSTLYIICICAEIMCVLHMKGSTVYYMCSVVHSAVMCSLVHSAVKLNQQALCLIMISGGALLSTLNTHIMSYSPATDLVLATQTVAVICNTWLSSICKDQVRGCGTKSNATLKRKKTVYSLLLPISTNLLRYIYQLSTIILKISCF